MIFILPKYPNKSQTVNCNGSTVNKYSHVKIRNEILYCTWWIVRNPSLGFVRNLLNRHLNFVFDRVGTSNWFLFFWIFYRIETFDQLLLINWAILRCLMINHYLLSDILSEIGRNAWNPSLWAKWAKWVHKTNKRSHVFSKKINWILVKKKNNVDS